MYRDIVIRGDTILHTGLNDDNESNMEYTLQHSLCWMQRTYSIDIATSDEVVVLPTLYVMDDPVTTFTKHGCDTTATLPITLYMDEIPPPTPVAELKLMQPTAEFSSHLQLL
uniref:Uncharacterized protein n=1 Tax=Lygus hesperus TaxID=30085 RepID=A0A0A9WRR1_LYGHE